MKKFRHLFRENEDFESDAARTLKEKPNKEQMKTVKEAVKDKFDIGEYDQEGDMAKSDLRSIMSNAKRVHDMLEDSDNLPEWVQSKITKAEDYMSTVANYMEAEMNEESESVPASKPLQNAHDDERKKRGLPDPSYYLKLRDQKKKEIEDMKKEEVELDEISPGLAARAASGASDPDYEGRASHENIARMATKKFGAKIGGQISNTDKGHWPKEYGSKKQLAPSGIDKLSWRKPTRTTASGKANKQDISALKNRMKEEVESLEEKNVPTSPEKWAQAKAQAKAKFDVYPSAYANGWAAKKYKEMGGGWKSVSEESELEEGYYKNQEIERQETERLAKQPPFTPDKSKKRVVAGKKPEGYSTARHLARQAMKKYVKEEDTEKFYASSRKTQIVKNAAKNKNENKFEPDPVLSKLADKKD